MKLKIFTIILVLFLSQMTARKVNKKRKMASFDKKECSLICVEKFYSCKEATVNVRYTEYKKLYNQSLYCTCNDLRGNLWKEEITYYPFVMTNVGDAMNPKWICE